MVDASHLFEPLFRTLAQSGLTTNLGFRLISGHGQEQQTSALREAPSADHPNAARNAPPQGHHMSDIVRKKLSGREFFQFHIGSGCIKACCKAVAFGTLRGFSRINTEYWDHRCDAFESPATDLGLSY